jgi:hypothetical protein
MIFKTFNHTNNSNNKEINVKDISYSTGHWHSEKVILNYLDKFEEMAYDKENLNRNLIKFCVAFLDHNPRVSDILCFNKENQTILCCISNVRNITDSEAFTRQASVNLPKQNLSLSLVEISDKEYEKIKNKELNFPDGWVLNETLTKKIDLMKSFV